MMNSLFFLSAGLPKQAQIPFFRRPHAARFFVWGCFLLLLLTGCKKSNNEIPQSKTLSMGTEQGVVIREINQPVNPNTRNFELDVNQDGMFDLWFRFDVRLVGFRQAQAFQSVKTLHDRIQVAVLFRADSVFEEVGDTIAVSGGYSQTSMTNCDGIGRFFHVHGPGYFLKPFGLSERVHHSEQDWRQGEFLYSHSSYQVPRVVFGVHNNQPFNSYLRINPPCSDFPQNQTVYLAFKLDDRQLGYVSLRINPLNELLIQKLALQSLCGCGR
jgi:hypothetical protein